MKIKLVFKKITSTGNSFFGFFFSGNMNFIFMVCNIIKKKPLTTFPISFFQNSFPKNLCFVLFFY